MKRCVLSIGSIRSLFPNIFQVDRELWATLANMLKRKGFQTPAEFIQHIILPAYEKRRLKIECHSYFDYVIWNWIDYLMPYIFPGLKNHSKHRSFRLEKKNNNIYFWYKENSLSPNWIGYQGSLTEGMYPFKDRINPMLKSLH